MQLFQAIRQRRSRPSILRGSLNRPISSVAQRSSTGRGIRSLTSTTGLPRLRADTTRMRSLRWSGSSFSAPISCAFVLELARAHFLNENFVAARAEFQRVLERSPPPNVQENIARFLAQMDAAQLAKRRQINGWGQLRGGYDTNVNSATEAEAITTPLEPLTWLRMARPRATNLRAGRWEHPGASPWISEEP